MGDCARQVENAKARRRMTTPDHLSKGNARMPRVRAELSVAARQEKNAKARKHYAKVRADMSDATRQAENAKARKHMVKTRAGMSDATRQENNAKVRKQMAKARAEMSDAAIQEKNAKTRKRMAKARAEMSDAARQAENAKARNRMALPENVSKMRDRRRKVRAERSTLVPVVHGRVQKATEDDTLTGKELSEGVYEVLALEHTDDSIGKLVDAMCKS